MVIGKRPPERPTDCAPNSAIGSVTRAIGRLFNDASPVKVAEIGVVAIQPMINRTPVPELPQSIPHPSAGIAAVNNLIWLSKPANTNTMDRPIAIAMLDDLGPKGPHRLGRIQNILAR